MKVISNTAISMDGKIASHRFEHVALGSQVDRHYMSVLRARSDAILVGGRTFRNWPFALIPDEDALEFLKRNNFFDFEVPAFKNKKLWNVIVSKNLDIPTTGSFYENTNIRRLFLSNKQKQIQGELEVSESVTIPWILKELEKRGIETLLLEAGGDLLFQFLEAKAIDEMFITICPLAIGGKDAPTLVDGNGFLFENFIHFELVHAQKWGQELFCKYRCIK